jgi:outer membrane receptor protein involved in Fe transport
MRSRLMDHRTLPAALLLALPAAAFAGGIPTETDWLDEVIVTGQIDRLSGAPISANVGVVASEQLALRPVLRTGELLEVVPGLIVTQHSGDGKANQYFLRGFNLDHGTDLATSVDGVPVNMPTHAHGQGYTDINFVIPELVRSIDYRKGTYYAETGNFSAAGAVNMRYRDAVETPLASFEVGENNYRRALLAASPEFRDGALLFGIDYAQSDGPWDLPQDFRKANALLRYSSASASRRLAITAQAYDGEWRSTDQIPLRAVRSGEIDRFGSIDDSAGGSSHRYSLGVDWTSQWRGGQLRAHAYAVDYRLDLFSNFTYATDRENGDQFEQFDDRRVYGGAASWNRTLQWGSLQNDLAVGVELRRDDVDTVGLYRTRARERIGTVREDAVVQSGYSAWSTVTTSWNDFVRTSIGLRADFFDFDVDSNLAINSGTASDSIASPKLSLIFGPWGDTEVFVNVGKGFHSNDARGTTIRVDPTDGATPADRVDPLVGAVSADVGMRTAALPDLQLSVSLWSIELDSELVFVGDAGVTEASRASRRRGIEVGAIWNPVSWLIIDADAAWSNAEFSDRDPAGDHIPGAVEQVVSLGIAIDHPSGWFGGARLRYFGSAPLIEDASVESGATTLVNIEAGYRIGERVNLSAAVLNVFDSDANDISYFYESQLQGEAAPIADVHFHPVEPRTLRITIATEF